MGKENIPKHDLDDFFCWCRINNYDKSDHERVTLIQISYKEISELCNDIILLKNDNLWFLKNCTTITQYVVNQNFKISPFADYTYESHRLSFCSKTEKKDANLCVHSTVWLIRNWSRAFYNMF